ncbi:hypothetical protein [Paraburkholderia sp. WC7.3d]|uniref:hypothetical protein n=1 Tax=Paraburkholderia sp. WC7.3d TaxID=2991069 RepID=UPI003D1CAC6B
MQKISGESYKSRLVARKFFREIVLIADDPGAVLNGRLWPITPAERGATEPSLAPDEFFRLAA